MMKSSASESMLTDHDIVALAVRLGEALRARGWHVATAESCTGGGIAAALTEVPGSSAWFEYGLVTYADQAKVSLLGVSVETLRLYGAVSDAVVREMASGALEVASADLSISVSGIAGPDGGSVDKPVGTVWFGWAQRSEEGISTGAMCQRFTGDRRTVRRQAVASALGQLLALSTVSQDTV